jgi:hypothetical protein
MLPFWSSGNNLWWERNIFLSNEKTICRVAATKDLSLEDKNLTREILLRPETKVYCYVNGSLSYKLSLLEYHFKRILSLNKYYYEIWLRTVDKKIRTWRLKIWFFVLLVCFRTERNFSRNVQTKIPIAWCGTWEIESKNILEKILSRTLLDTGYNFNCENERDLFDENLHWKYQLFIPLHKR